MAGFFVPSCLCVCLENQLNLVRTANQTEVLGELFHR
jgi:hypothetical protein